MKSPKTEKRVISMEKFASLHAQAKSWDEVEKLFARLLRTTKEKYDEAYKQAGEHTSRTGRKAAVFIIGERKEMGVGWTYSFRMMDIDGLNSDSLATFVQRLGNYQLIRTTWST